MKYGYENISGEKLIQHYEISNNKIIIKYLDGTIDEMLFTKENESNLLKIMFEQAKSRSKSAALKKAISEKLFMASWTVRFGGFTMLSLLLAIVSSSHDAELYACIVSCFTGIPSIFCGARYASKNSEIKELEKYDIYLSIKDRLERNISRPSLFYEVNNKQDVLNINTLDNYSLKDILTIRHNLEEIEQYNRSNAHVKKFEKKISK